MLVMPLLSKAQATTSDSYKLLEPLPCIPGTSSDVSCDKKMVTEMKFTDYLGYVFKFAIAISAFLAVVMIIWGGFEIMLSEAIPSKMDGKKKIIDAITGLLMVLSSYLILRTIDPRLVQINLTLKKVDTTNLIKGISTFKNSVDSKLVAYSTIQQNELGQLDIDISKKQSEIDDVEKRLKDTNLSEQETNNLKERLETAKVSKKDLLAKKTTKSLEYASTISFKKTRELINSTDNDSNNQSNIDSNIENITKQYDIQIFEAMGKATNTTPDTGLVVKLKKQKEYFLKQIDEEVKLNDIKKGCLTNDIDRSIPILENTIGEINKNRLTENYLDGIGIDSDIYNAVVEDRINTIQLEINFIRTGEENSNNTGQDLNNYDQGIF